MKGHLDRGDLISRLLADLHDTTASTPSDPGNDLLARFARIILGRVDDSYLYRHRLTTLASQLRDSFSWLASVIGGADAVSCRAFRPALKTHGYSTEGDVIETLMPDQPFIFDTLKLFMEQHGLRIMNSLHVILPARIDGGVLAGIGGEDPEIKRYSYTRWYVHSDGDADLDAIREGAKERLDLTRAMVRDFDRMVHVVKAQANEYEFLSKLNASTREDCMEIHDVLNWLVDDNFIFMGISFCGRTESGAHAIEPKRGLGTVRNNSAPSGYETAPTLEFLGENTKLAWPVGRVRKSGIDSVIHRRGKVDEIVLRTFDDDGEVIGGMTIHGLFTFKGLSEPGTSIPVLRKKFERVISKEGIERSTYEHKMLVHAFNALPVEFLFEAEETVVSELLQMTVTADDTHQIRAHVAVRPGSSSAYVFVVLPKENYSNELRTLLQAVLQVELAASYADHRVHLGKYGSVALHFYMTGTFDPATIDVAAIEERLVEIGTPWTLRLRRQLEAAYDEERSSLLYDRYAVAFSEGYTELTPAAQAVRDIEHLEQVVAADRLRFDVFASPNSAEDALLRIYSRQPLLLTDILPVVDNLGVVVAEQYSHEIGPEHVDGLMTINTLRIQRGDTDLLDQREALIDALAAVFEHKMRSDRINRLLLKARIGWMDVEIFRAYFNYSRQLSSQLTAEITQKILTAHGGYAHDLIVLFKTRFDPDLKLSMPQRQAQQAKQLKQLNKYLDGVQGYEEDRVLRLFLNLLTSTIRTNFYRIRPADVHYLSFKIDCASVAEMPEPRPLYEIYVHHAELEGVHLRGGRVARGGLRWSDRLDDYRSEVLGLMATQMLKNTLIVPGGAKGGFVLKSASEDWSVARQQADTLYEVFISGLLDLTDNVIGGQSVPPDRVVRYDGDDPYLVVAADKGTAHLSDTANRLSAKYGFWLSDAFASGGSVGYDHKEKGITARGAWVCVKRLFTELGIDPESDVITVSGIGDMSGDVFGNGLLCSESVKLVGAFNHRHIFIDPDPDPAASFGERRRLFDMGRSSWSDYDPSVMSEGGGIYERDAKAIALSVQARERFGTTQESVSGADLIKLILTADVDLLWNGGIGTYVKASAETHADVADTSNDRVRVDANALQCRVIGEGGNLGVTQRARVEFAMRGGRINLDAIDNSGGVDLSDHEVNLKTLLSHPVAAGTLSSEERDALLISVGDPICEDVLANNESQALAISLDEVRSKDDIWSFVHSMMYLRKHTGFSRRFEKLPRGRVAIQKRIETGRGFLRPELGNLLSYSKMHSHDGLVSHPVGDAAVLRPYLEAYFPDKVVKKHGDAIDAHFLYNEIAATVQVNRIVGFAGVTLFPTIELATERRTDEVAAAYLIAERALGIPSLRDAILRAPDVATDCRYAALIDVERHLARATRSLLWANGEEVSLSGTSDFPEVTKLSTQRAKQFNALLPDRVTLSVKDGHTRWTSSGFSPDLARVLSRLSWMDHVFAIAAVARAADVTPVQAARAYVQVGYATRILDLTAAADRHSYADPWDHTAVHTIIRSLVSSLGGLAIRCLQEAGTRAKSVDVYLDALGMNAISDEIQGILTERVPVSALLVISERFKRRLSGQ